MHHLVWGWVIYSIASIDCATIDVLSAIHKVHPQINYATIYCLTAPLNCQLVCLEDARVLQNEAGKKKKKVVGTLED